MQAAGKKHEKRVQRASTRPRAVGDNSLMSEATSEIIRIGGTKARITSVTRERVDYLDEREEACSINLQECASNWVSSYRSQDFLPLSESSVDDWNSRCVGERDTSGNSPWVEFRNDRRTRIQFVNDEEDAIYVELLGPLGRAGWHTFDVS
jgi:hypothetical protein